MNALHVKIDYDAWGRQPQAEVIVPRLLYSKDILAQTARDHGMSVARMLSRRRDRLCAYARFDAMARLRAIKHHGKPRYSLPAIGRMMGRDHTTVLNGVRRWAEIQAKRKA